MLDQWSRSPDVSTLTGDILQELLREAEEDSQIKVFNWRSEDVTGQGGYSSSMFKIHVDLKDEGEGGRDLILKIIPESGALGDVIAHSSAFPTEVKMYREILPKMLTAINKSSLNKYSSFEPKFYYGQDFPPYILFLQDLTSKGFTVSKSKGLDLEHSLLVMETIGRFHAASLTLEKNCAERFSKHFLDDASAVEFMKNRNLNFLRSLASVAETWPDKGAVIAWRLRRIAAGITEAVKNSLKLDPSELNVLNHGDLWGNNMLFHYDETTATVNEVKLIDYQQCYYNSPAIDLQYFINTTPADEVRAKHLDRLLEKYHASFCETLKMAGVNRKSMSLSKLKEVYEKKNIFGFYAAITILPSFLHDPSEVCGPEIREKFKSIQIDLLSRLTGKQFTKVFQRLLPYYMEKNIL